MSEIIDDLNPVSNPIGYDRPTNHFQNENCLVTNMSMTECIRPALYQAYHHVTNIKLNDSAPTTEFNVVGPVCESSDFLNKLGISGLDLTSPSGNF